MLIDQILLLYPKMLTNQKKYTLNYPLHPIPQMQYQYDNNSKCHQRLFLI